MSQSTDVTDNTTDKKDERKNHNEQYGTAWYLKSHEYYKDKRRIRRETKQRRDSYGGVFS